MLFKMMKIISSQKTTIPILRASLISIIVSKGDQEKGGRNGHHCHDDENFYGIQHLRHDRLSHSLVLW